MNSVVYTVAIIHVQLLKLSISTDVDEMESRTYSDVNISQEVS